MSLDPERRLRFETLFAAHHAAVRSYVARRAGGGGVGIDDAVADTFLVAWRRLDDVPDASLPWLLGVARRVLADQRRSADRRRSLVQRLRTADPAPGWAPPVSVAPELASALASLTEHEREALLLVAWDELTPAEAAVAAGCSAAAFRVRLHRARRRVAARLGITDTSPRITEKLS
jgi:RNA polymerase sigma factor (sigma-70 family)